MPEIATIGVSRMIPRIREIKTMDKYKLYVIFDSDEHVIYDVEDDINTIDDFSLLKSESGLFENVALDPSRTCVYWTDRIDLASDTILEFGKRV